MLLEIFNMFSGVKVVLDSVSVKDCKLTGLLFVNAFIIAL